MTPLGNIPDVPAWVYREPVAPEEPFIGYGAFVEWAYWSGMLGESAARSALKAGALERRRLGPRRGWRYAATTSVAWRLWRSEYMRRARRLREAIVMRDAALRLGYAP